MPWGGVGGHVENEELFDGVKKKKKITKGETSFGAAVDLVKYLLFVYLRGGMHVFFFFLFCMCVSVCAFGSRI